MQSRIQRPHFTRTALREKQPKPKSALLARIIKRIGYARLRMYFKLLHQSSRQVSDTLAHAFKLVGRNLEMSKLLAWKKMLANVPSNRLLVNLVKGIGRCSAGLKKRCMESGFRAIVKYVHTSAVEHSRLNQRYKTMLFLQAVDRLSKKTQLKTLFQISTFSKLKPAQKYRQMILGKVLHNLVRSRKYIVWGRFCSANNSEHGDLQHELGEKAKQLDNTLKQLSKANNKISELQRLLSFSQQKNKQAQLGRLEKRQNQLSGSRKSMKSSGYSRKNSNNDSMDKKSEYGNNQNNVSILSWLNGSFMSIKSGRSSRSRSITGVQCFCKYRQKYNHYKCEVSSLKNQLEIIKTELEVTKDLNQHLQEQISSIYMNARQESPQLAMLRKQVKQLRREKQISKQNLLKTQKYIAHLKYEFKVKVQSLYRSLKITNS